MFPFSSQNKIKVLDLFKRMGGGCDLRATSKQDELRVCGFQVAGDIQSQVTVPDRHGQTNGVRGMAENLCRTVHGGLLQGAIDQGSDNLFAKIPLNSSCKHGCAQRDCS